jgi:hypothetical protein
MIKYKKLGANKVKFNGFEICDISEKVVTIKDLDGKHFRIEESGYSSLNVVVEEEPKPKIVYRVEGEYKGLNFSASDYDLKEDALEAIADIEEEFGVDIKDNFKIKQIEIFD